MKREIVEMLARVLRCRSDFCTSRRLAPAWRCAMIKSSCRSRIGALPPTSPLDAFSHKLSTLEFGSFSQSTRCRCNPISSKFCKPQLSVCAQAGTADRLNFRHRSTVERTSLGMAWAGFESMRGPLALPQNLHDLDAFVKPDFAVPSPLRYFVTEFTINPTLMRWSADAVSVDTASACPASDFMRKLDRFRRSDGTLRRLAQPCRGANPVAPDGALAGP